MHRFYETGKNGKLQDYGNAQDINVYQPSVF